MDQPITCRWEGDCFVPASSFWAAKADKALVVGEVYRLVEHHDRSMNSHRHYFAVIAEAHKNLPDEMLEQYPNPEALIWKGYRDERTLVASSKAEAERMAAFIKPMDDLAVVTVRDCVVRVWTAKSQKVRAMGAKEFATSKNAVLDFVADLIGVDLDTLSSNSGAAA